jgi:hypothetical protein
MISSARASRTGGSGAPIARAVERFDPVENGRPS